MPMSHTEDLGMLLQEVARLRKSEAELLAMMNSVRDLIFSVDRDFKVLSANAIVLENFNHEPLTRDSDLRSVIEPSFKEKCLHLISRAFEGESVTWTQDWIAKQAERHRFVVLLSPIYSRDKANQIYAVTVVVSDVTESRRAELSLEQERAKTMYASKMAALGEMASGVAHEINNPLSIIIGRAGQLRELIQRDEATPEILLKSCERIESTAERISRITRGLRSFARDGQNDPFAPVAVKELLQECLELCRERFHHQAIEIRMTSDIPSDLTVECRSSQIAQVLLNLLNNSLDALALQTEKWVSIQILDRDSNIELQVTDSGPGIPTEIADKIMQPFFTTKELGRGTGLGLSISKGIVETHHGFLRLDTSCPNTRFVISLPKLQRQRMRGTRSQATGARSTIP
jgi:PAS domain S-box-containing protein